MKKIAYILSLIIAVTLVGCGNTGSSDVIDTQSDLAETADAAAMDDQTSLDENSENGNEDSEGEDESSENEDGNAENGSKDSESGDGNSKNDDGSSGKDNGSSESEGKNPENKDDAASTTSDNETSNTDDKQLADMDAQSALPEYTVTAFEETKSMYATDPVNVRSGPTTDFERVGGLRRGEEVTVTGQADTMWYEIQYGDNKAFVSNKYLQDDRPIDEPVLEAASEPSPEQTPQPQEAEAPTPVTEVKNVAGVILVGDSRFVQMQSSVGENSCTWIAEGGKGYNWFNEKAIPRIDSCVGKGSKILINLGVNDTGNLQKYISLVNAKADEWTGKGATVYYASVNPVWENPYVNEEQVEYFNSQMQSSLNSNVHWIDSHSYLISIGYKLVDGLHYSTETYQNIYAYYMNSL